MNQWVIGRGYDRTLGTGYKILYVRNNVQLHRALDSSFQLHRATILVTKCFLTLIHSIQTSASMCVATWNATTLVCLFINTEGLALGGHGNCPRAAGTRLLWALARSATDSKRSVTLCLSHVLMAHWTKSAPKRAKNERIARVQISPANRKGG